MADTSRIPCIYVLAGTNGGGKSSIAGAMIRQSGADYVSGMTEANGAVPRLKLLLHTVRGRVVGSCNLALTPEWVKPIVAAGPRVPGLRPREAGPIPDAMQGLEVGPIRWQQAEPWRLDHYFSVLR